MKRISFLLLALVCLNAFHLLAQDKKDDIIGKWNTGENTVEIYYHDGRYIGNPLDNNGKLNEDIEILNLEYNQGRWTGKIYAVKRKRLLDTSCKVKGDTLYLEVKAGRSTRDMEWTRVK
jgi:uncharacterized protein (DUF2147 family)